MKKFIKAVIVASVLVSASSAFAVASRPAAKQAGANGTIGTECAHGSKNLLFVQTNELPAGSTSTASGPVTTINGIVVK